MREATRRQILTDLGIVSWRLRGAAPASSPEPEAAASEPAASEPAASEPASSEPASSEPASRAAASESPAAQALGARAAEHPWSALLLGLGGAVLVVPGELSRRDRRLARDLLAAACGDWQSAPDRRRFAWPLEHAEALAGDPAAGARAFAAFVEKSLDDHRATVLLCGVELAQRLSTRGGCRRIEIPALAEFGRDMAAKRAVWGALAERRS